MDSAREIILYAMLAACKQVIGRALALRVCLAVKSERVTTFYLYVRAVAFEIYLLLDWIVYFNHAQRLKAVREIISSSFLNKWSAFCVWALAKRAAQSFTTSLRRATTILHDVKASIWMSMFSACIFYVSGYTTIPSVRTLWTEKRTTGSAWFLARKLATGILIFFCSGDILASLCK